ncbi:hypothetical protein [Alkalihalobacillus pseudalcaliphilus]|uniref:hypothetical protein n=1 Tax=Alkalihalobacillus pseudalcaliphilus TaxID=79884 RepID=UPI00064DBFB2|nr:hypothetical protein [Alkalihalobacillus pseudalcaliphilus]KMK76374.1 hypothetical protein AB990_14360 [Alkalihalobacillus pseudalcaliphilus]
MQKQTKFAIFILILFLIGIFLIPISIAQAEEKASLHIETKAGFDGKITQTGGFPLEVTLSNSGEDLSGELVIHVFPTYQSDANIIIPVDIPAGETRSVLTTIPGHDSSYYYGATPTKMITFYETSFENGKEVKTSGKATIAGSQLGWDAPVMGILSNDPESLRYLNSMTNTVKPQLVTVEPDLITDDYIALTMLDYLVVDQFTIAELSSEQQQAIQQWVLFGGTLILGGDPAIVQKSGELKDSLPMSGMISTVRANSEALEQFNGETPYDADDIVLYIGDVDDDLVKARSTEGYPLIVSAPFGTGELVQLSFSPGISSFSSWQGSQDVWRTIINQNLINGSFHRGSSIFEQLNYNLAEVNNLYPSTMIPIGVLISVFIAFIVIVFPFLFFILKKFDKREHSWWVIPTLSILVAVSLFGFGAKDRIAKPQMNHLSVIKLNENEQPFGYASFSLFSNNSGDYTISVAEPYFTGIPIMRDSYSSFGTGAPISGSSLYRSSGNTDFSFQDVEYWAVRNAIGPIMSNEKMYLENELLLTEDGIIGQVTNQTGYDLEELEFVNGNKTTSLGPLLAGETIDISIPFTDHLFRAPQSQQYWQYQHNNQDFNEIKVNNLMITAAEARLFEQGKPALVGHTTAEIFDATIKDRSPETNSLHLLVQSIDIEKELVGEFSLKLNDIMPKLVPQGEFHYLDDYPLQEGMNSFYASAGEFHVEYDLPRDLLEQDVNLELLTIQIRTQQASIEIWNESSQEFESVDQNLEISNVRDYVSEEGQIEFKVVKPESPEEVSLPNIELKGVYAE